MYQKKKDGTFYNPKVGRIVEHHGYSTRIHWSTSMLDYLRRHFPTTLNEELAGCLGVSQRTMIRKARELGLQKDEAWLHQVWEERRCMAHIISRRKGYPGGFVKGVRNSPDTEFKKGHTASPEVKQKQAEGMRRWYRRNPDKASAKALKAWETRRSNSCQFVVIRGQNEKREITAIRALKTRTEGRSGKGAENKGLTSTHSPS